MRGEKNWQGSDARTGKIAMPGICSHLRRTVSPGSCARSFTRRIRAMVSPAAAEMNTAYIDAKLAIDGASAGPLAGLTFAVKDMYDIAGQRTGFGNPSWKETHPTATATAPVVQQLLDAGASLRGKTHCDELTYSLNGENTHYGTPPNPAAPGHIPGGSSSGSASACAAGDVDFALGSDTGGSIRIPASYCGLFGLRPTHGRVSLAGARPLAPSFDCAGHFARDANVLKAVGDVLLGSSHQAPSKLNRWLVASDAFALAQPPTRQALRSILSSRLEPLFQKPAEVNVAEGLKSQSLGLSAWFDVFRICQGWEIWREHGEWIRSHNPSFGPGVAERFKMVSELTEQAWQENARKREQIRAHVTQLLQDDGALLMPTAPGPAPLLATPAQQLDDWRKRMISLTSLAGLCGLPEVSLPVAKVDGLPVGMSIVGPAGSDEDLLELAGQVALLLESKP